MTLRTRIAAAFSALSVLAVAGSVHAQFSPPTCVPPNCSPEVIQNIAVSGAAQSASINITGSGKMGGTFQAGALAPVLTAATDNLYYGNVGGTSTNGALLLLQFGSADRLRVGLTGQMQIPLGTNAAPSYTFIGDTNTGIYSGAADTISFATNGTARALINNSGTQIVTGQLLVPTGSAGAPTYTFTGDGNTGMYRSAADTLNLATAGVSRLQIDATGLVTIPGGLTVQGTFTASGGIGGDGSALTNLNASNITSGTLNDARLSTNVATYSGGGTFTGVNTFSNAGNSFTGNGAGLTSLNASNITTGTLADGRLSANVALLDRANQTFTGNNNFTGMVTTGSAALPVIGAQNLIYGNVDTTSTGALLLLQNESVDRFRVAANGDVTATSFSGVGTNLTALNASNLASGTVPSARLSGTYANALTFSNRTSFGSATLNVAAGQNLLYGNVDTASLGNLILLQNEGADRFRVDAAGNVTMAGNLTIGGSMVADGSGLTGLNASNITSGTLNDARLSSNVALLNGVNNFTGTVTIGGQGVCLGNGTNCPMSGAGTANYVTKWTGATTLGNSLLRDDGTSVAIGNTPTANTMLVVGPTSQSIGFTATTNAANGVGVYGFGLGSTSIGVYGQGTGAGTVGVGGGVNGVGVQGSGQYAGVTGAGTGGSSSVGVQGSGPNGVYGIASDVWGYGVRGVAAPNSWVHGVLGTSSSSQFNSAGVAGISTNNAMGGYFQTNTAGVYALLAYNGAGGNAFQAQGTSSFTGAVSMSSTLYVGSTLTANGILTVAGNTTLGDAAGDTLTINGTSVSTPNNLNFDANTLYIDAASNYVGIGHTFPSYPLDVNGRGYFAGEIAVGGDISSVWTGYGVASSGNEAGGHFYNTLYPNVWGALGYRATTNRYGVWGNAIEGGAGTTYGGYFNASGGTSYGVYANGSSYGVYANGSSYGLRAAGSTYGVYSTGTYAGYFGSTGGAYAYAGYNNNYGIYGSAPAAGGYGLYGNGGYYGVYAQGAVRGGDFYDYTGGAHTFIAGGSYGVEILSGGAIKPSGIYWSNPSDARLKKDIAPFKDGLAIARQLNPKSFTFNGLGGIEEGLTGTGFIAQEVEDIVPYMIEKKMVLLHPDDTEETEIYVLDQSEMPLILLNSVKELDLMIVGLEAKIEKIDEVDARVKALEQRVERLEEELDALREGR